MGPTVRISAAATFEFAEARRLIFDRIAIKHLGHRTDSHSKNTIGSHGVMNFEIEVKFSVRDS